MSLHLDERRLFDALDGPGTAPDQAHLQGCAACRSALERKRAALQALQYASARPLSSPRLRQQADRLLASLPAAASTVPLWRAWPGLAGAGLVGAALVLLTQTALLKLNPATPNPAPALTQSDTAPTPPLASARAPALGMPEPSVAAAPPVLSPVSSAVSPPLSSQGTRPVATPGPSTSRLRLAAPAAWGSDEESNDYEMISSINVAPAAAVSPTAPAAEMAASAQLELLLGRLETDAFSDPLPLLQELPILLRVAARQLEPQHLEVIAQRIASLALVAPADEAASFLACETALLARRYPAALDLCQAYLDRFPQGPRAREVAFLAASTARVQLGDCASAVPLYDRALTFSGVLQSYNDDAYLGRARCRLELGDRAGARTDLDLFLFKAPERHRDSEVRALLEQLQLTP